jgi:hypothetical protein
LGRRFKVEWSLGTLLIEPASSLYEFLTVWRHDRKRPFSESERQIKELLMPHLVEMHRAVRLRHFLKIPNVINREWALVDARGILHEASPAFIALASAALAATGVGVPCPSHCSLRARGTGVSFVECDWMSHRLRSAALCQPRAGWSCWSSFRRAKARLPRAMRRGETYSAIAAQPVAFAGNGAQSYCPLLSQAGGQQQGELGAPTRRQGLRLATCLVSVRAC